MTDERDHNEKPTDDKSEGFGWGKKLIFGGVISLAVSIGGMFFNSTITDKRNLTAKVAENEKAVVIMQAKITEMEKYQLDLIDSMLTEERVLNDLKVRIAFLERAIGLETYVQYLKSHAGLAKQLADADTDTPTTAQPPVPSSPLYEKPKDLNHMLNNQLQQTIEQPPPLIDKVKEERFKKHMEGQRKQ